MQYAWGLLFAVFFLPVFVAADTCPSLSLGSRGSSVTAAQQILYQAYANFPTPTGYFGPVTQAAVKQWQKEHGISQTGTVGPITARAMDLCTSAPVAPTTVSTSAEITSSIDSGQIRTLSRGMSGADVTALQQFLVTKGLLPQSSVIGIFGPATEAAVKKFQSQQGIVSSGTPSTTGYGIVGPRTRATIAGSDGEQTPILSSSTQTNTGPLSSLLATNVNANNSQCSYFAMSRPTEACPSGGKWEPLMSGSCQIGWRCSASVQSTQTTQITDQTTQTEQPSAATILEQALGSASCALNGRTIASGSSVTAYQASSVPFGQTCMAQVRTCSNGSLSGSAQYQYSSCSQQVTQVTTQAACTVNGVTFANGSAQTFYSQQVVPFGETCSSVSQSRTCTNGTVSGISAYRYRTCTTAPQSSDSCTPLSAQTQTISCPAGQTGAITQTRTSSCASGASSPTWSAWSNTASTCTTPAPQSCSNGLNNILYPSCVCPSGQTQSGSSCSVPAASCTPLSAQTQTISCPTGQTGSITQSRTSSCAAGASSPTWSAWSNTTNTCATPQASHPTLNDLFAGTAHFQSVSQSQAVSISFSTLGRATYDEKLQLIKNPTGPGYYSFARRDLGGQFTMVLLSSSDGVNFSEVGKVFNVAAGENYYDASVIRDPANPSRYIMAIECAVPNMEHAGTCVSTSNTPSVPSSWSKPTILIDGCNGNPSERCSSSRWLSASTPMLVVSGGVPYVAWTSLDVADANFSVSDGTERTLTYGRQLSGTAFLGYANSGTTLLSAEFNTHCTSAWDCNNRNGIDWIEQGGYIYMAYSGGNYYACDRPTSDDGYTVAWGIGIARSGSALGGYARLPNAAIMAEGERNLCRITYPTFSVIDGQTYLYFSYSYSGGQNNKFARSKLVWNDGQSSGGGTGAGATAEPVISTCGAMGGNWCSLNSYDSCPAASPYSRPSNDCAVCCGSSPIASIAPPQRSNGVLAQLAGALTAFLSLLQNAFRK